MKRQLADERRRTAERLKREQAQKQAEEELKREQEDKEMQDAFQAVLKKVDKMVEKIREEAGMKKDIRTLLLNLVEYVTEEQKIRSTGASQCKDAISELRVEINLKEESIQESVDERDKVLRQLTAKAMYGGTNTTEVTSFCFTCYLFISDICDLSFFSGN